MNTFLSGTWVTWVSLSVRIWVSEVSSAEPEQTDQLQNQCLARTDPQSADHLHACASQLFAQKRETMPHDNSGGRSRRRRVRARCGTIDVMTAVQCPPCMHNAVCDMHMQCVGRHTGDAFAFWGKEADGRESEVLTRIMCKGVQRISVQREKSWMWDGRLCCPEGANELQGDASAYMGSTFTEPRRGGQLLGAATVSVVSADGVSQEDADASAAPRYL